MKLFSFKIKDKNGTEIHHGGCARQIVRLLILTYRKDIDYSKILKIRLGKEKTINGITILREV